MKRFINSIGVVASAAVTEFKLKNSIKILYIRYKIAERRLKRLVDTYVGTDKAVKASVEQKNALKLDNVILDVIYKRLAYIEAVAELRRWNNSYGLAFDLIEVRDNWIDLASDVIIHKNSLMDAIN